MAVTSAVATEPGEATLDHPTLRTVDSIGRLADYLNVDEGCVCKTLGGIGGVGEGTLDKWKATA